MRWMQAMRRTQPLRWTQAMGWAPGRHGIAVAHCWEKPGSLWTSPRQSNAAPPGESSALGEAWRRMLGPSAIPLRLIHERRHGQRWRPRLLAHRPQEVRTVLCEAKHPQKVRHRKVLRLRVSQRWLTHLMWNP
jgi:hypothetical protein